MSNQIEVFGSLNPEKECQDRVRVLSGGGICQALRATDYKDPPKVLVREVERYGCETGRKSDRNREK